MKLVSAKNNFSSAMVVMVVLSKMRVRAGERHLVTFWFVNGTLG